MNSVKFIQNIKTKRLSVIPGAVALILGYLIYLASIVPIYFSNAFDTDEYWFFNMMTAVSLSSAFTPFKKILFSIPNELAYGSIYWLQGSWIQDIKLLRFESFLFLLSLPVFLFKITQKLTKDELISIFVLLSWLTFPAAWHVDKIIGPELMSAFFGMFGIYLAVFSEKKGIPFLGAIFLGISAGIKLNSALYIVFSGSYLFFIFLNDQKKIKINVWIGDFIRKYWSLLPGIGGGLVISNLFILKNPSIFFGMIKKYVSPFSLEHSFYIFFNRDWEWDAVFIGGLFNLSFSIISIAVLVFMAILSKIKDKSLFVSLLLTFSITVFMILRERYLGWYWMPFITLFPLILSAFDLKRIKLYALLPVLIFFNLLLNGGLISDKLSAKNELIVMQNKKQSILACMQDKLNRANQEYPDISVYNFSEVGFTLKRISKNETIIYKTDYEYFLELKNNTMKMKFPALVFLGDRLSLRHEFLSTDNFSALFVENDFSVKQESDCEYVRSFLVKKKN